MKAMITQGGFGHHIRSLRGPSLTAFREAKRGLGADDLLLLVLPVILERRKENNACSSCYSYAHNAAFSRAGSGSGFPSSQQGNRLRVLVPVHCGPDSP